MDKVFPLGTPRNTLRNVLGVRPETPAERGLFTWAATVSSGGWLIWLICLPWRCFYHQPGDKPSTFSPSTGLWSIVPTRIIQLSFHGVYILYLYVCIYSIRHVPQYNLITRERAKLSIHPMILPRHKCGTCFGPPLAPEWAKSATVAVPWQSQAPGNQSSLDVNLSLFILYLLSIYSEIYIYIYVERERERKRERERVHSYMWVFDALFINIVLSYL